MVADSSDHDSRHSMTAGAHYGDDVFIPRHFAEPDRRVVVLRRQLDCLAEVLLRGVVLAEAEREQTRVDARLDELRVAFDSTLERLLTRDSPSMSLYLHAFSL